MIQGEFLYQILFDKNIYFIYLHREEEDGKVVAEEGHVVTCDEFLEIIKRVKAKAEEVTKLTDMSESAFKDAVPLNIDEQLRNKDQGKKP